MDYTYNNKEKIGNFFISEIACRYGVEEAVFIHGLYLQLKQAKEGQDEEYYRDGRYWAYKSRKAYAELFPFMTERQLRRIIENLNAKGVLHIENYNRTAYDRTLWYSLSDEIIDYYGGCKNDA